MNIDLRDQLKECHEKIKQLTILEENYKDQVSVNQTLCIERERALAAKERALAELNAEKVTIKGWSDASEKVDEILASGRNVKNKKGLGFTRGCPRPDRSMLKFGMFVSSIPDQLQDYDIQLSKIPIYCDNTSAIAIANNPVLHSKTKHIEVRYHSIRDHVMNGDIELHLSLRNISLLTSLPNHWM
ncbi:hypothetical protein OSB04_010664 [Centaurea solstitialis]|uniref:Copia protein n=1 Tax=Centaurea solstitialis TaxID=347529 RepID=A0AA38T802_9ASTR|nr:hypothetical protein OSB04_010664 [Centaurea solstitialis]